MTSYFQNPTPTLQTLNRGNINVYERITRSAGQDLDKDTAHITNGVEKEGNMRQMSCYKHERGSFDHHMSYTCMFIRSSFFKIQKLTQY